MIKEEENCRKPVKVLQMISSLSIGGSQSMILNVYNKMDKERVHFDFIIDHTEDTTLMETVKSMGSKVFVMPTFTGNNIIEIIKAWNSFFKTHKEYKIIHSHSRSYASIYLSIAKRYGLKTIIHSHSTSNGGGFSATIKGILELPLRRVADYLFACSLDAGKWLYGKASIKKDNFYIVNNAINTDSYIYNEKVREEYRNKFGLKDEKVLIQIGRLIELKNHFFTLSMFSDYLNIDPEAKLFIVGDGEMQQSIMERISDLSISSNVTMLESRNDVNNLLQMSDVFLMPSMWEGISLAAVEAQASGIRTILSDKVSKEVGITDVCVFLPLDKSDWINNIKEKLPQRRNMKEEIEDAGFDVSKTSKWLTEFYERINNDG